MKLHDFSIHFLEFSQIQAGRGFAALDLDKKACYN